MRPAFVVPPKPVRGDRVAIVSPSWAAPALFPDVHELAMRRIRDELGLIPVEYPTTRRLGADARSRAADLMSAFADPRIRAVFATVGGDDQLTVLPHLDARVVAAHPKPFFGYSDNTNLLNWLWNLGIVGFHGGSTMVHLGRGVAIHPISIGSLRHALFSNDVAEIRPVDEFSEDEISWDDPESLTKPPVARASDGWSWHGPAHVIEGPTWGGNLEVLHWNLAAGRWMRPVDDYEGCIFVIETSEEMPAARDVHRMLRNMGERGLLGQCAALVVGRPKASSRGSRQTDAQRVAYVDAQRDAVLRAAEAYAPGIMIVFGLDIGHTDPQWIVPYGGLMRIDAAARSIHVTY